jgi:hypothetical protein
MSGIRTYATTSNGLQFNELIVPPTMPVITLAGSEENSMGRGGLDQPGRRRLFEANPSGAGDPDDGDEPLMVGEAPPEDDPAEVLLIVPTEEDVEGFLAGHIYTEEQTALLELAQSGEGDSEVAWASLVDSLTASFALHMIDQFDPF